MGFDDKNEGSFHRVPKLEGAPANVYFSMWTTWRASPLGPGSQLMRSYAGDVFGTPSKNTCNPLTGSMFLLEYTDNPEPAPFYDY